MSDNLDMPREGFPQPPPLPITDPTLGVIRVTINMSVSVSSVYSREDAVSDLRHLHEQIVLIDPNANFETNISESLKEITL